MMYGSRLNGLAHMHIQKNKEINLVQVLDKFDTSQILGELPLYIVKTFAPKSKQHFENFIKLSNCI
jgi:hypothetical protein